MAMSNPWEVIAPPDADINVRRVDADHPFDFFWGKDSKNKYLFVYQSPQGIQIPRKLPDLQGFDIQVYDVEPSRLVITLRERPEWELFQALCMDLLQATRTLKDRDSVSSVIVRRLSRWHAFLSRGRPGILTEACIKGLMGELIFLRDRLAPHYGIEDAVNFWKGPEGAPQDFNVGQAAVEVKCQSGATSPKVRITSVDQLCPQLPEMFLFVVTLGTAPESDDSALCLPQLIAEITEQILQDSPGTIERFLDILHRTGYVDMEEYREYRYVLVEERLFELTEGFPRICPASIPEGVEKVAYDILIDHCIPFLTAKICPGVGNDGD